MAKRILNQGDIDNNPILTELGLTVGMEIEIPDQSKEQQDAATTDNTEGGDRPGTTPQNP